MQSLEGSIAVVCESLNLLLECRDKKRIYTNFWKENNILTKKKKMQPFVFLSNN